MVLGIYCFNQVNSQRDGKQSIYTTYISPSMYMPYSQATQLILDLFNFKPEKPKYPQLGYAYDIGEFYQFS